MQTIVWKKQTDVLKQAHIAAAMIATYGERAVFVDGRIDHRLVQMAVDRGNIKAFFNRRFHDRGVHWQRLVYFQTISTRRSGQKKRGVGNLHFHALMILPARQTLKQIRSQLELVFGKAGNMGSRIQFKFSKPDWQSAYTFNGVTAKGPIGKVLYVQQGMGGTFNDLKLNENGKRSRKAPIERLCCNRQAKGLARGVPSHFNAKATLCDHVSTEAGRKSFLLWLNEERELKRNRDRSSLPPTVVPVESRKPLQA